jgi:NlpC/P60 family/Bacterial dipeptidyl-peptidase Sh3 domain
MLPEVLATDPRLLPQFVSVAADKLRGVVEAKSFVHGERMQVSVGAAALRRDPDASAEQINQALFGEGFTVYRREEGWAYGQLDADSYVGCMRDADLAPRGPEPTHRVSGLRSFIFSAPHLKSTPLAAVSMNALLALGETKDGFVRVLGSGWIFHKHVSVLGDFERDFVSVAERFLGAPYLWGGRETAGIDCSGLVQVSLQSTGRSVLRDSDMQEITLGERLAIDAHFSDLKRGDLVFWRGHVGMMANATDLLHASAYRMQVEIEPLREAVARIRPIAGEVGSFRRMR